MLNVAIDKQRWVCELIGYLEDFDRGIIVGVEVVKPQPWAPAAFILELHEQGVDVETIMRKVCFSRYTVERAISTKGEDWRTGEQCMRYASRVFSIREALLKMPLPCGLQCACSWRAVLRSDAVQ